ncbi:MAG: T9SS type A sorting domain-containing protein [Saprospiraceae bacterium]|nr:T9SS type A sorting domain-containing protein [Lewinella sp.]
MKHIQLVILCFVSFTLGAQITVTNKYFPQAGDTLLTATDNMPSGIEVGTPGPDRTWNFKSLQSPLIVRTIVRPASEGAAAVDFPDADLVFKLNENAEGYYRLTDNTLELIGLSGTDPINLGIDIQPKLNEPQIERWAPLKYGDTHDSAVNFSYALDADEIPQDLLDILPITPDSIRVRLKLNRHDEVDAWGTMSIPGGDYEVLREKRTLDQDIRLDAKIGILGWQDITDIVLGLTDLGGDVLGNSQIVRYHYWGEGVKEAIAVVTMNPDQTAIATVDFKAEDILADLVQTTDKLQPSVLAYPNPAMAHTNFQFMQLKPGNYRLVIYNLVGSEVWHQNYRIHGPLTERVSLSNLKKGTYLYALQDERGRTLITRRLVVVRP